MRCPYLSPSSDLSFYKNRDFLLCPYGMKLDGAVDGKQIRKTLLSTRLKDFADRNRRFRCDDCVAIMDGLSARAAGMEVKK